MVSYPREIFLIGVVALFFTIYYLEKHYKKEEIFWTYSAFSAILGLFSAYTVVTEHASRRWFIPLTAISIVLAIIYYQSEEKEEAASGTG